MGERYTLNVMRGLVFPERYIRGSTPYENAQDKVLVQKLYSGKTRLLLSIIPEIQQLPQRERIGLVYAVSLVFHFDDAIDNNPRVKNQIDGEQLEAELLECTVDQADITLAQLKQATLNHFPSHKSELIGRYWSDMIAYQARWAAEGVKQKAGTYTYNDVLAYRSATNDKFVEVLCALRDIEDPMKIIGEKQRVFLIQLVDDVLDWKDDITDDRYNLLVGLARQQYPEEFDFMIHAREGNFLSRKQFLREHMPQTYGDYLRIFNTELATIQRASTRLAFNLIRQFAF